jgi:hypothetical protein
VIGMDRIKTLTLAALALMLVSVLAQCSTELYRAKTNGRFLTMDPGSTPEAR